jgi:soluble lytic murein transglycosylase-like protein
VRVTIGVGAALALLGVGLALWPEPARQLAQRVLEQGSLARVESFAAPIRAVAAEQDLDPCLVAAIVYVESRGRVDAVSSADALGLMQLTQASAEDAARARGLAPPTRAQLLEDAERNLRLGARHFAWTFAHEERDLERALCAYNAGRGRMAGWIREAGSYRKWRARQMRDGDSQVLAYALKVLDLAEVFRERGLIAGDRRAGMVADEQHGPVR